MKQKHDSLGILIKSFEKSYENRIDHDKFLIVRIDGHKFSKFTKKFKKPYDPLLSQSMENTTKDLIDHFGASIGYTQSDEITLVFPPVFDIKNGIVTNNQIFSGRTQKIASLIASFTSIRFNYWMQQLFNDVYIHDEFYKESVTNQLGNAWFDARIFGLSTKEDACKVVLWRWRDALKNSCSMFSQTFCSHKALLNKTGVEQIKYCFEKTGNDWNLSPDRFKYGIFVKKDKYVKKITENIYTDCDEIIRTRITTFTKNTFLMSDENIELVISKSI